MKKLLVVFWFFLLAPVAWAQSVLPPCIPLVRGYPVGVPKIVTGDVGLHIFQYCSDSKGAKPQPFGLSCIKRQCSEQAMGAAIEAVTRASAKVGTAREHWDRHIKFDCTEDVRSEQTERGALCRERWGILLKNHRDWQQ